jgi:hypothetical protein
MSTIILFFLNVFPKKIIPPPARFYPRRKGIFAICYIGSALIPFAFSHRSIIRAQ